MTFFWIQFIKISYKISKITTIRINIYGITPKTPTKDPDTKDYKILFWSLIAVGFKMKNTPTLQSKMKSKYGNTLKIIEGIETMCLVSNLGPHA